MKNTYASRAGWMGLAWLEHCLLAGWRREQMDTPPPTIIEIVLYLFIERSVLVMAGDLAWLQLT